MVLVKFTLAIGVDHYQNSIHYDVKTENNCIQQPRRRVDTTVIRFRRMSQERS